MGPDNDCGVVRSPRDLSVNAGGDHSLDAMAGHLKSR